MCPHRQAINRCFMQHKHPATCTQCLNPIPGCSTTSPCLLYSSGGTDRLNGQDRGVFMGLWQERSILNSVNARLLQQGVSSHRPPQ
eukprot:1149467-Pelagomonas_calceolata.AAC.6